MKKQHLFYALRNQELQSFTCSRKYIKEACQDAQWHLVSNPTEIISAFLDEFLKPIVQELPSYINDTTLFLQKIDEVGEISDDTYMVTIDVKSLHTNISNGKGLRTVEELEKRSVKTTPSFARAMLMELVLIPNNFEFNGFNYLQKKEISRMCLWDTSKNSLFTTASVVQKVY